MLKICDVSFLFCLNQGVKSYKLKPKFSSPKADIHQTDCSGFSQKAYDSDYAIFIIVLSAFVFSIFLSYLVSRRKVVIPASFHSTTGISRCLIHTWLRILRLLGRLRSSRDLLLTEYRRPFGVKESRKHFINISLLKVMIAEDC